VATMNEQMTEVVRLRVRPQFLFVRGGLAERRRSLVIQARRRPAADTSSLHMGEGFTATKKVGNSVVRNRARRRLKAAAHQYLPQYGLPGVDYVFIARMDTAEISWQRLLDDMESALISLAAALEAGSGPA